MDETVGSARCTRIVDAVEVDSVECGVVPHSGEAVVPYGWSYASSGIVHVSVLAYPYVCSLLLGYRRDRRDLLRSKCRIKFRVAL
jgi:hypothetical protein